MGLASLIPNGTVPTCPGSPAIAHRPASPSICSHMRSRLDKGWHDRQARQVYNCRRKLGVPSVSGQAGADEIEVTPEMIEAGVDCAADLGVEGISLDTLAQAVYRSMVLASRGQHLRSFVRIHPAPPLESVGEMDQASGAAPSAVESIRVDCLMNARYHAAREAFLDAVHRWIMFGVIVFGAGAAVDLLAASQEAYWLKGLLGAGAAILGVIDLAFDLSNRARAHSLMKRRYFELLADVVEGRKPTIKAQACLNRYSADEEPAYHTLLLASWNAAQEMSYGDGAYEYDISAWDRFWQNVWRFEGKKYPLKQRDRASRMSEACSTQMQQCISHLRSTYSP
jgi:hypothetical protein